MKLDQIIGHKFLKSKIIRHWATRSCDHQSRVTKDTNFIRFQSQ